MTSIRELLHNSPFDQVKKLLPNEALDPESWTALKKLPDYPLVIDIAGIPATDKTLLWRTVKEDPFTLMLINGNELARMNVSTSRPISEAPAWVLQAFPDPQRNRYLNYLEIIGAGLDAKHTRAHLTKNFVVFSDPDGPEDVCLVHTLTLQMMAGIPLLPAVIKLSAPTNPSFFDIGEKHDRTNLVMTGLFTVEDQEQSAGGPYDMMNLKASVLGTRQNITSNSHFDKAAGLQQKSLEQLGVHISNDTLFFTKMHQDIIARALFLLRAPTGSA